MLQMMGEILYEKQILNMNNCFFFRQKEEKLRESLGEFSIPFADLNFEESIRKGRRRDIFK